MEKLGWTSNIVHEIPMMSTTWFNFQEQNEEVHFFLKKNVHVNRMILCNRKPHPNCLNEFADEIKSTRRKQIFSLLNAFERKKIEFQVGVCPFYWLFQAHSRLNMKSIFWIKNRLDKFCAKSSKKINIKWICIILNFAERKEKKEKHGAKKSRRICVKFNMYAPICAVRILNDEASEEKIHSSTWFVRLQPWRNPLIW